MNETKSCFLERFAKTDPPTPPQRYKDRCRVKITAYVIDITESTEHKR